MINKKKREHDKQENNTLRSEAGREASKRHLPEHPEKNLAEEEPVDNSIIPKPVQKSLIYLLKQSQRAVNKGDVAKLNLLSERAIQDAALYQDEDSLTMAVVLYAIAKIIERYGLETEYPQDIRNYLSSATFSIESQAFKDYRYKIKKIIEFIYNSDKQFKIYIEKVMEKAQIKKGSNLYEKGISVSRAANLLGIGQWELMSYIGKTKIHDKLGITTNVGERIRVARSLFR